MTRKNCFKALTESASAQRVLEVQRNFFHVLLQYITVFRGYESFQELSYSYDFILLSKSWLGFFS